MRPLKYLLAAAAVVLLLVAGGTTYLAATFDPNAYKPQIAQLVKEKTRRMLKLEGDVRLAFWPGIGAEVGRMSLSEPDSEREFAAMEGARVSLKLLPLLSREVVVDELSIRGLRAAIVRGKAGASNIDDLLGKKEEKEKQPQEKRPVAFDIAHVALDNAALEYRDDASGAQYALSGLTLKTGRIAPDVPTKIEVKTAARSNKPALDLALDGRTRLVFNLERQRYRLDDLAVEIKGQAAGLTNLAAKATGNVNADLQGGQFAADKLVVTGSGMRGKEKLELKLDAPNVAMTADKASGGKIAVALTITAPEGATTLNATLPGIEGTAKSFRSAAMTLDLERKQPERTVKARMTSPVTGGLEAKQFSLPQLKANVTIAGAKLPAQGLAGELTGSASVDAAKSRAQANLAGKIADSTMKARLAVTGFAPLALDFDVDVDRLDLDRFAGSPQKSAADKPGAGKTAKPPEEPIDVSALRELRASGSLRVGALKTAKLSASNVRVDMKANGGRVDFNPVSAQLYQGSLSGTATVNAASATPAFSVRQTLTGVNVGPLLRDLADTDTLEGKGNVSINVTTQGSTVGALKKALNGSAAVKLADGAIKGIDIAGAIRKGQAMLGSAQGQAVQQQTDAKQRTDFSELTATFDIRNGVAHNNDLSIKSPLLRVGGAGSVNIGEDALDYTVKASLVATTAGQGGKERTDLRGVTVPVRVSGPFASPSYQLDVGAMVTDTARQKIEDAVTKKFEERLGGRAGGGDAAKDAPGGRKALEDSLRGLFGK